jgi:hypothetical protein
MSTSESHPSLPNVNYSPLTPEQRDADAWAEQALQQRLPATRDLAQKWGATVTALTALLGTGTIIDADDAVRALESSYAVYYGIAAGGALLAAAASILFASQAGQVGLVQIPPGVKERVALRNSLFEGAARKLRVSGFFAAVAVVLLIASFGIRWYAPQKPAPPPTETQGPATPAPAPSG